MNYYFCVDIPWENTSIWVYNSLEELKEDCKSLMDSEHSWYIIKGEEIDIERGD